MEQQTVRSLWTKQITRHLGKKIREALKQSLPADDNNSAEADIPVISELSSLPSEPIWKATDLRAPDQSIIEHCS